MGDRCELYITYRIEDEDQFTELLGEDWFTLVWDEGDGWQTVHVGRVNRGLFGGRERLRDLGLSFLGEYGHISGFGCFLCAAYSGQMSDVQAMGGKALVTVNDDGEVDPDSLREARKYLELYKKASEFIGVNSKATTEDSS